jgi:hypothetical protein
MEFMMKKENTEKRHQILDKTGREILLAAQATDAEVEAAVASPFLYAKIRARMQEEQQASTQPFYQSFMLFAVMRRAISILAVIAVLALCSYTFTGKPAPPQNPALTISIDRSLLISPPETKAPVTACSITSRSECVVSTDDVVALLVNSHERQK